MSGKIKGKVKAKMECKGKFVFRSIEKKEAGSFTNENGVKVDYPSSYQIKVDEMIDGKPQERRFKFDIGNKRLADVFYNFDTYTICEITFDVNIYASSVKLVPKIVIGISDDKK